MACALSIGSLQAQDRVIDTLGTAERGVYSVENTCNYYEWQVEGGTIVQGEGSYKITVQWNEDEGLHRIRVHGLNKMGCPGNEEAALVFIRKKEEPAPYLYVPTAFSPNGDGSNDQLEIYIGSGYTDFKLQIFDRWGATIFTAMRPEDKWDGTVNNTGVAVPDAVYVMQVYARYGEQQKIVRTGTIAVVR